MFDSMLLVAHGFALALIIVRSPCWTLNQSKLKFLRNLENGDPVDA